MRADAAAPAAGSVAELVARVARLLEGRVEEPRAEARDLIAALADAPRFWPTLHAGEPASEPLRHAALAAATRRAGGAPFAYAVGRSAFRHLTLAVDPRVLIPRQETELLVDLVLDAALPAGGVAVDVGTGSGAIALALASEGRFGRVVASDLSRDALAVAAANVSRCRDRLRAPVDLVEGAFLAPVASAVGARGARVIASNPPYIAFAEASDLPPSVRDWEPPLALYGGADGLAPYRVLVRDAAPLLEPGGLLAMEVDARRASLVAELAAVDGRYADVSVRLDLAGRERFVLARARGD